jgi:hypothetical protein
LFEGRAAHTDHLNLISIEAGKIFASLTPADHSLEEAERAVAKVKTFTTSNPLQGEGFSL